VQQGRKGKKRIPKVISQDSRWDRGRGMWAFEDGGQDREGTKRGVDPTGQSWGGVFKEKGGNGKNRKNGTHL